MWAPVLWSWRELIHRTSRGAMVETTHGALVAAVRTYSDVDAARAAAGVAE